MAETVTDGMGTWKTSLSCRAQAGRLEVVESTQECSQAGCGRKASPGEVSWPSGKNSLQWKRNAELTHEGAKPRAGKRSTGINVCNVQEEHLPPPPPSCRQEGTRRKICLVKTLGRSSSLIYTLSANPIGPASHVDPECGGCYQGLTTLAQATAPASNVAPVQSKDSSQLEDACADGGPHRTLQQIPKIPKISQ